VYTIVPPSHKLDEANVDGPQINGGSMRYACSSIGNRKSSIKNYLRAYLTAMDRNPEAVEKALVNKP
jgi:hypothetical protein